jgi:uncharacterized protein YbaR (Trm112 family)
LILSTHGIRPIGNSVGLVVQYQGMIAKELLEILVCPVCITSLDYRTNPESLKCAQCHRVYAVKDNIPIMLVDEATMEP